ncbi:LysE family translocator [Halodesulfovibrio aestuarii]|uniref:LysE family translocator n=1 Tax=Halodesulfovibrio aestuarii TaxID=126333 RepID=A0ABV4JTE3_9BACT
MIPDNFGEFLIAITILAMIPGADTMMVIRNSIRGGFTDGAITSVGICSGLFFHATISGCGLALILYQSAQLYHFIKIIGAFYIVWLGFQNLWDAKKRYSSAKGIEEISARSETLRITRSLREGVLSNVLNPKTAVFYITFMPQFMSSGSNPITQIFFLTSIHFCISFIWQCLLASIVGKAKEVVSAPKSRSYIEATAGSILIGLGIKLAATE